MQVASWPEERQSEDRAFFDDMGKNLQDGGEGELRLNQQYEVGEKEVT